VVNELSDRTGGTNFGACLPRRFEHYHLRAATPEVEATPAADGDAAEEGGAQTIHELAGAAMEGAREAMVYDLLPPAIGRLVYLAPGEPVAPRVAPGGHPPASPPTLTAATYDDGCIRHPVAPGMVATVEATLDDDRPRLRLAYRLDGEGGLPPGRVGIELCLALPGCDSPATHYAWPDDPTPAGGLGESVERDSVAGIDLVDTTVARRLRLRTDDPALTALAPMRTVSQSEAGVDVCYQQSWVMVVWPLPQGAPSWHGAVTVEIDHV